MILFLLVICKMFCTNNSNKYMLRFVSQPENVTSCCEPKKSCTCCRIFNRIQPSLKHIPSKIFSLFAVKNRAKLSKNNTHEQQFGSGKIRI